MLTRLKGQNNTQHRLNAYIGDCKEDMTAINSYVCLYFVLGALCYVCVPKLQAHDFNISARARRVWPRARATRVREW